MSTVIGEQRTSVSRLGRLAGPYRALSGNRDLGLLFGGQVISALGDWLYVTTLIVLAYTLTGSALFAAMLSFARLLPYALFVPIAGVLADRYDRRLLMIVADVGRAACMLGLLAATTRATIWLAFPLVFAATCLGSLFRPALGAMVPAVAGDRERLVEANALMSQIDGLSLALGPALAGILILLGEARGAFAINAATYAISAGTLLLLRTPSRPPKHQTAATGWLAEVLTGVRFLFGEREGVLGAVTLSTAGMTAFNGASWTLLVALATQTWHFGNQGAGFLLAGYGVGGLLGGFVSTTLAHRVRPSTAYICSLATSGLLVALFGLSPAGLLPFTLLAGFGAGDVVNQVVGNTIIQTMTPDALLGRVLGAFEAIVISTMVLGALAAGPLIATVGPRATTVALAMVALATLLSTLPRLRVLERGKRTVEPFALDSALVPAAN
ncbi:MAG TPA: MFS transporter [Chloroflexota bacterium]|nr:MFS transporter [Chloroflexota bacterium]